jgi:hypothetical protein
MLELPFNKVFNNLVAKHENQLLDFLASGNPPALHARQQEYCCYDVQSVFYRCAILG